MSWEGDCWGPSYEVGPTTPYLEWHANVYALGVVKRSFDHLQFWWVFEHLILIWFFKRENEEFVKGSLVASHSLFYSSVQHQKGFSSFKHPQ